MIVWRGFHMRYKHKTGYTKRKKIKRNIALRVHASWRVPLTGTETLPPVSRLRVQPRVTSRSHSQGGTVDARGAVSAHVRFELLNRERARARARVLCVAVSRSAKRLTMADEKPKVSAAMQPFRCPILLRSQLELLLV